MHLFVCIYLCAFIYLHSFVCIYLFPFYVCIRVHSFECIYLNAFISVNLFVCIYLYAFICLNLFVWIYLYAFICMLLFFCIYFCAIFVMHLFICISLCASLCVHFFVYFNLCVFIPVRLFVCVSLPVSRVSVVALLVFGALCLVTVLMLVVVSQQEKWVLWGGQELRYLRALCGVQGPAHCVGDLVIHACDSGTLCRSSLRWATSWDLDSSEFWVHTRFSSSLRFMVLLLPPVPGPKIRGIDPELLKVSV